MSKEERKKEIIQLLRDYRVFETPFGGAAALDETGVRDADYGPNGLVFTGAEFDREYRWLLRKSYLKLNVALNLLQRDHMDLWVSLVEPYLQDEADPGTVEDWRRRVSALDAHNADVRKRNYQRQKAAKKNKKPPRVEHERVALIHMRRMLERHDKAVSRLAEYLRHADLVHLPPKVMSEEEEASVEKGNAEIHAVFQRLRVAGRSKPSAVWETAERFKVSEGTVERIIEFRSHIKLVTCTEEDCEDPARAMGLCKNHYERERYHGKTSKNTKNCS